MIQKTLSELISKDLNNKLEKTHRYYCWDIDTLDQSCTACHRTVSVFCRLLRTSLVWLEINVIVTCLFLGKTLSHKQFFSNCFSASDCWVYTSRCFNTFLYLAAIFLKHASFWSKLKYKLNFWLLNDSKFDLLNQIIKCFPELFRMSKLWLDEIFYEVQFIIDSYHAIFILLTE